MRTCSSKSFPRRRATRPMLIATALIAALACSQNPAPGGASGTSSMISSALALAGPLLSAIMGAVPGLTEKQAGLAAGSLLGLAKVKMPTDQFSYLTNLVPGTDALVTEAQNKGAPTSPSNLAAVSEFLGAKAGMSSSQVSQVAAALTSTISGKVPDSVASAFAAALH